MKFVIFLTGSIWQHSCSHHQITGHPAVVRGTVTVNVCWCDRKVWSFYCSVCFRASVSVLCSGRPASVGNRSFVLWARARARGRGRTSALWIHFPECPFVRRATKQDLPTLQGDEWWWVRYRGNSGVLNMWGSSGGEGGASGDKDVEFVCRSVKGGGAASAQQTTCSRAGSHVTVNGFCL